MGDECEHSSLYIQMKFLRIKKTSQKNPQYATKMTVLKSNFYFYVNLHRSYNENLSTPLKDLSKSFYSPSMAV